MLSRVFDTIVEKNPEWNLLLWFTKLDLERAGGHVQSMRLASGRARAEFASRSLN